MPLEKLVLGYGLGSESMVGVGRDGLGEPGRSAVSLLPLHGQRGSLGPTCSRPGGAPGEEDGGIGGNWMRTDRRRRGLIVPQDTVRPGATRPTSPSTPSVSRSLCGRVGHARVTVPVR